jgi:hypothetical protein
MQITFLLLRDIPWVIIAKEEKEVIVEEEIGVHRPFKIRVLPRLSRKIRITFLLLRDIPWVIIAKEEKKESGKINGWIAEEEVEEIGVHRPFKIRAFPRPLKKIRITFLLLRDILWVIIAKEEK